MLRQLVILCVFAFICPLPILASVDSSDVSSGPQCRLLPEEGCTNASMGAVCEWQVNVALEDYCGHCASKGECMGRKKCAWIATGPEEGYCAPSLCQYRPCAALTGAGKNNALCIMREDCHWHWLSEDVGYCANSSSCSISESEGGGTASALGGLILSTVLYFGFLR